MFVGEGKPCVQDVHTVNAKGIPSVLDRQPLILASQLWQSYITWRMLWELESHHMMGDAAPAANVEESPDRMLPAADTVHSFPCTLWAFWAGRCR